MRRRLQLLAALALIGFLTACVSEPTVTRFKDPSAEDLEQAIANYVSLAYEFLDQGKQDMAMVNVQRAMEIDSTSPLAHNAMAIIFQTQGEEDKARESFETALRYDSSFSQGRLNYGSFLFSQQEYEEACEQFAIVSEDSTYQGRALAYFNLGICMEELGDLEAAEEAYERCLSLSSEFDYAYIGALLELAEIRYNEKRFAQSKQLYDEHAALLRKYNGVQSPRALWLGIRLERLFENPDAEASLVLFLKNTYPYSEEYLQYKEAFQQ